MENLKSTWWSGFWSGISIGFAIMAIIFSLLASCTKPNTVCYECWSSTGIHEIFDNTTPETMQHTIEFWAENGIILECKQIQQ